MEPLDILGRGSQASSEIYETIDQLAAADTHPDAHLALDENSPGPSRISQSYSNIGGAHPR